MLLGFSCGFWVTGAFSIIYASFELKKKSGKKKERAGEKGKERGAFYCFIIKFIHGVIPKLYVSHILADNFTSVGQFVVLQLSFNWLLSYYHRSCVPGIGRVVREQTIRLGMETPILLEKSP